MITVRAEGAAVTAFNVIGTEKIGNPALGIVDALRPVADNLASVESDQIVVHYLEVYGGKVTAASKQYTGGGKSVGYRLFDIAVVDNHTELLDWDSQRIAGWRDGGGQQFLGEAALSQAADAAGLELTRFQDYERTLKRRGR